MPFLVISVEGALRGADSRYEEAAATLGASRWTAFHRVTLPLIAPGIAAGAVLCWARALGEFGATITFAGNFPGRTQTMPLAVYLALEQDLDAAIVLSLVLLTRVGDRARRAPRPVADHTMSGLDARLVVRRPAFTLDLALTVRPGEVVALLGPNGAGKSTALRALAGLIPLDDGRIDLDGRRLDDPAGGVFVGAEHRRIGVVFQDYLLFPHLSALDNVAFGPRCRGASRAAARAVAADWLARVGLGSG